jgi:Ca-activated chloride channel family protein
MFLMGWIWPGSFVLLLILPLAVAGYWWALKRRKRFAVHYSSLTLFREAQPEQWRLRRHFPFLLLLLALFSLILALARPTGRLPTPSGKATIILALDVSLSMCASDIPPNRLTVAQAAAESLIRNLDEDINVGIVAFAGFTELVVPPTGDVDKLLEGVDSLVATRRTAIGSAIVRSIDAISRINANVAPLDVYPSQEENYVSPAVSGNFQPDIIVLLTDGSSNRGADPIVAAQAAIDRGIRVFTIGFGTQQDSTFVCTQKQLGGVGYATAFGGGGEFIESGSNSAPDNQFRIALDEETLRTVASVTEGEYYLAESAEQLLDVFAEVPSLLDTVNATTEISAFFTGIGAILLIFAFVFSQRWHPLP